MSAADRIPIFMRTTGLNKEEISELETFASTIKTKRRIDTEWFRPDGIYMATYYDDTAVISKWDLCDKCEKPFEKSTLQSFGEIWLCETCRSSE